MFEALNEPAEVCFIGLSLNEQMKMVRHEAVGTHMKSMGFSLSEKMILARPRRLHIIEIWCPSVSINSYQIRMAPLVGEAMGSWRRFSPY